MTRSNSFISVSYLRDLFRCVPWLNLSGIAVMSNLGRWIPEPRPLQLRLLLVPACRLLQSEGASMMPQIHPLS